ncbi:MAG: chondroitinase family protein, partial [Bacteroidota bacterium]
MKHFHLLLLLSFLFCNQLFAFEKHGNYLDIRIGTPADTASRGLLYYPNREIMFDFDTENPLEALNSVQGNVQVDRKFYMTAPQSLRWETKTGATLQFKAPVKLQKTLRN